MRSTCWSYITVSDVEFDKCAVGKEEFSKGKCSLVAYEMMSVLLFDIVVGEKEGRGRGSERGRRREEAREEGGRVGGWDERGVGGWEWERGIERKGVN